MATLGPSLNEVLPAPLLRILCGSGAGVRYRCVRWSVRSQDGHPRSIVIVMEMDERDESEEDDERDDEKHVHDVNERDNDERDKSGNRNKRNGREKETVQEDLASQKEAIGSLSEAAEELKPSISQHDTQLITDHITTLESRLQKAQDQIASQLESSLGLQQQYDQLRAQIQTESGWLDSVAPSLDPSAPLSSNMADPASCHADHSALMQDITEHAAEIDRLHHQGALLATLSDREREATENDLKELAARVAHLKEAAAERKKKLAEAVSNYEALQLDVSHVREWLDGKEAEKTPTMALKQADVSKQLETLKRDLTSVRMFGQTVSHLMEDGNTLAEQHPALKDELTDLQTRYDKIRSDAEARVSEWQNGLARAKLLEADLSRLELWLTEASKATDKEPKFSDVPLEKLQANLVKIQNLASSGEQNEELLGNLLERKDDLQKELSPADQAELADRLARCKENLSRVRSECTRQQGVYEEGVSVRQDVDACMTDLTRVLVSAQLQLREMCRGIGPRLDDAHNMAQNVQGLQDDLADCEPKVSRLQQSQDQQRILGHTTVNEDLPRLLDQYQQTLQQVSDQKQKVDKACKLRERFYGNKGELEMKLKQCEEQLQAVEGPGVTTTTKLDRYKAIVSTLSDMESQISQLEDEAQQISIEAGPSDSSHIHQQVSSITDHARKLRSDAQNKLALLTGIVSERSAFEKELTNCLSWLQQQEKKPIAGESSNLSLASVDHELAQIKGLEKQLQSRLQPVLEQTARQRESYRESDETVPLELQDKMDQLEILSQTLQDKLHMAEQKLEEGQKQREEYHCAQQEVTGWLNKAQQHLQDQQGLDYDRIPQEIQAHQAVFADVPQITERMDVIFDVVEKLRPTLDLNDAETLKQSVSNLNNKLTAVTATAQQHQHQMETVAHSWKEYKDKLQEFHGVLEKLEDEKGSSKTPEVHSLSDAKSQLQQAEDTTDRVLQNKPQYLALLDQADALSIKAHPNVRETIEAQKADVISRWDNLQKCNEEKQYTLQDVVSVWETYETHLSTMEHLLIDAQNELPPEDIATTATVHDLENDLERAAKVARQLDGSAGKMSALQRACHQLLAQLPAGSAKSDVQKKMTGVQDKFQQLQWQAADTEKNLEAELNERSEVTGQLEEVRRWLRETALTLQSEPTSLDPDDIAQYTARHEELRQQLALKMALVQRLIEQQGEKYTELPNDLNQIITELQQHQDTVSSQLSDHEEKIATVQQAQNNYAKTSQDVAAWLDNAETVLGQIVPMSIEAGQQQQQDILEELPFFEAKIAQMRLEAEKVSAVSTPEVADSLNQTINQLVTRFQQIQQASEQKKVQLMEAAELQDALDRSAQVVIAWTDTAHSMGAASETLTSPSQVKAKVMEHQAHISQAEAMEQKLAEMDSILNQLDATGIQSSNAQATIQAVRERFEAAQAEMATRLAGLEEAAGTWEDVEGDVREVGEWLRETAQERTTAGTPLERLSQTEQVLDQIQHHEVRLDEISTNQDRVRELTGSDAGDATSGLREELAALKQQVLDQQKQLEKAVAEQEMNATETARLRQEAEEAQKQLEASAIEAGTAEQLKQELAKQKAELERIKGKLAAIKDYHQRNADLEKEARELEPVLDQLSSQADEIDEKLKTQLAQTEILLKTAQDNMKAAEDDSCVVPAPPEEDASVDPEPISSAAEEVDGKDVLKDEDKVHTASIEDDTGLGDSAAIGIGATESLSSFDTDTLLQQSSFLTIDDTLSSADTAEILGEKHLGRDTMDVMGNDDDGKESSTDTSVLLAEAREFDLPDDVTESSVDTSVLLGEADQHLSTFVNKPEDKSDTATESMDTGSLLDEAEKYLRDVNIATDTDSYAPTESYVSTEDDQRQVEIVSVDDDEMSDDSDDTAVLMASLTESVKTQKLLMQEMSGDDLDVRDPEEEEEGGDDEMELGASSSPRAITDVSVQLFGESDEDGKDTGNRRGSLGDDNQAPSASKTDLGQPDPDRDDKDVRPKEYGAKDKTEEPADETHEPEKDNVKDDDEKSDEDITSPTEGKRGKGKKKRKRKKKKHGQTAEMQTDAAKSGEQKPEVYTEIVYELDTGPRLDTTQDSLEEPTDSSQEPGIDKTGDNKRPDESVESSQTALGETSEISEGPELDETGILQEPQTESTETKEPSEIMEEAGDVEKSGEDSLPQEDTGGKGRKKRKRKRKKHHAPGLEGELPKESSLEPIEAEYEVSKLQSDEDHVEEPVEDTEPLDESKSEGKFSDAEGQELEDEEISEGKSDDEGLGAPGDSKPSKKRRRHRKKKKPHVGAVTEGSEKEPLEPTVEQDPNIEQLKDSKEPVEELDQGEESQDDGSREQDDEEHSELSEGKSDDETIDNEGLSAPGDDKPSKKRRRRRKKKKPHVGAVTEASEKEPLEQTAEQDDDEELAEYAKELMEELEQGEESQDDGSHAEDGEEQSELSEGKSDDETIDNEGLDAPGESAGSKKRRRLRKKKKAKGMAGAVTEASDKEPAEQTAEQDADKELAEYAEELMEELELGEESQDDGSQEQDDEEHSELSEGKSEDETKDNEGLDAPGDDTASKKRRRRRKKKKPKGIATVVIEGSEKEPTEPTDEQEPEKEEARDLDEPSEEEFQDNEDQEQEGEEQSGMSEGASEDEKVDDNELSAPGDGTSKKRRRRRKKKKKPHAFGVVATAEHDPEEVASEQIGGQEEEKQPFAETYKQEPEKEPLEQIDEQEPENEPLEETDDQEPEKEPLEETDELEPEQIGEQETEKEPLEQPSEQETESVPLDQDTQKESEEAEGLEQQDKDPLDVQSQDQDDHSTDDLTKGIAKEQYVEEKGAHAKEEEVYEEEQKSEKDEEKSEDDGATLLADDKKGKSKRKRRRKKKKPVYVPGVQQMPKDTSEKQDEQEPSKETSLLESVQDIKEETAVEEPEETKETSVEEPEETEETAVEGPEETKETAVEGPEETEETAVEEPEETERTVHMEEPNQEQLVEPQNVTHDTPADQKEVCLDVSGEETSGELSDDEAISGEGEIFSEEDEGKPEASDLASQTDPKQKRRRRRGHRKRRQVPDTSDTSVAQKPEVTAEESQPIEELGEHLEEQPDAEKETSAEPKEVVGLVEHESGEEESSGELSDDEAISDEGEDLSAEDEEKPSDGELATPTDNKKRKRRRRRHRKKRQLPETTEGHEEEDTPKEMSKDSEPAKVTSQEAIDIEEEKQPKDTGKEIPEESEPIAEPNQVHPQEQPDAENETWVDQKEAISTKELIEEGTVSDDEDVSTDGEDLSEEHEGKLEGDEPTTGTDKKQKRRRRRRHRKKKPAAFDIQQPSDTLSERPDDEIPSMKLTAECLDEQPDVDRETPAEQKEDIAHQSEEETSGELSDDEAVTDEGEQLSEDGKSEGDEFASTTDPKQKRRRRRRHRKKRQLPEEQQPGDALKEKPEESEPAERPSEEHLEEHPDPEAVEGSDVSGEETSGELSDDEGRKGDMDEGKSEDNEAVEQGDERTGKGKRKRRRRRKKKIHDKPVEVSPKEYSEHKGDGQGSHEEDSEAFKEEPTECPEPTEEENLGVEEPMEPISSSDQQPEVVKPKVYTEIVYELDTWPREDPNQVVIEEPTEFCKDQTEEGNFVEVPPEPTLSVTSSEQEPEKIKPNVYTEIVYELDTWPREDPSQIKVQEATEPSDELTKEPSETSSGKEEPTEEQVELSDEEVSEGEQSVEEGKSEEEDSSTRVDGKKSKRKRRRRRRKQKAPLLQNVDQTPTDTLTEPKEPNAETSNVDSELGKEGDKLEDKPLEETSLVTSEFREEPEQIEVSSLEEFSGEDLSEEEQSGEGMRQSEGEDESGIPGGDKKGKRKRRRRRRKQKPLTEQLPTDSQQDSEKVAEEASQVLPEVEQDEPKETEESGEFSDEELTEEGQSENEEGMSECEEGVSMPAAGKKGKRKRRRRRKQKPVVAYGLDDAPTDTLKDDERPSDETGFAPKEFEDCTDGTALVTKDVAEESAPVPVEEASHDVAEDEDIGKDMHEGTDEEFEEVSEGLSDDGSGDKAKSGDEAEGGKRKGRKRRRRRKKKPYGKDEDAEDANQPDRENQTSGEQLYREPEVFEEALDLGEDHELSKEEQAKEQTPPKEIVKVEIESRQGEARDEWSDAIGGPVDDTKDVTEEPFEEQKEVEGQSEEDAQSPSEGKGKGKGRKKRRRQKKKQHAKENIPEDAPKYETEKQRAEEPGTSKDGQKSTREKSPESVSPKASAEKQENLQLKVRDLDNKLDRLTSDVDKCGDGDNEQQHQRDLEKLTKLESELVNLQQEVEGLADNIDADDKMADMIGKIGKKQALVFDKIQKQRDAIKAAQDKLASDKEAYDAGVMDYEAWLHQAQMDHANDPVLGLDPEHLDKELQDNQAAQVAVSEKLEELTGLNQACGDLQPAWTTGKQDFEKSRLQHLRGSTQSLLDTLKEREDAIRQALDKSSSTQKDIDDYQKSVDDLEDWMQGQKGARTYQEEQDRQQQAMASQVAEHRELVASVRDQARDILDSSQPPRADDSMDSQWRTVARQLADKTRQLQQAIDASKPQPGSRSHFTIPSMPATSDTTSLGDIQAAVNKLHDLWREAQGQMSDRDRYLSHLLQFQHLYHSALLTISQWLDHAEGRLFDAPGYGRDGDEVLRECGEIQRDMEAVNAQLDALHRLARQLKEETSAENGRLIQEAVTQLGERVTLLEKQATERHLELMEEGRRKREAEKAVAELHAQLQSAREKLHDLEESREPVEIQAQQVQQVQEVLGECNNDLDDLAHLSARPREFSLQQAVHISGLTDECDQLTREANRYRGHLGQQQGIAEHYEKMLEEYAQYLETAQAKLQQDAMAAADLTHFRAQLQAHNDFFADLASHQGVLDSLVEQVDPQTRAAFHESHERLNNLTQLLQDKASVQAGKMDTLVEDWEELAEELADLQAWFDRVCRSLPGRSDDGAPVEELRHQIWEHSSVSRALADERGEMQRVVNRGRRLLQAVSCPVLEADVNGLADRWLQVTSDTAAQITRLETIVDQCEKFERDAGALETWLDGAEDRLAVISASSTDPGSETSLSVLQQRMRELAELRADAADRQHTVRARVTSTAAQLSRHRPHDHDTHARAQRLDTRWLNLMYKLPNNEERLHAAQMEVLPSRLAVHELTGWLDGIEATLKEDLESMPRPTMLDTQELLYKYKGLKIELSQKQLTVDFVNESIADTSIEGDHTDFAERLGQMNNRFEHVASDVLEMVKKLDLLTLQWEEYDKTVHSLANWLDGEKTKLERYEDLGHEVSVTQAMEDIKNIGKNLNDKQKQIEQIGNMGRMLAGASEPSEEELHQHWLEVQKQLCRTSESLQQKNHQWGIYRQSRDRVNELCTKVQHQLQGFRQVSGNLAEFDRRIGLLETMGNDLRIGEQDLNTLLSCGQVLSGTCGPTVGKWLANSTKQHEQKYLKLQKEVADQAQKYNALHQDWTVYDQLSSDCEQKLKDLERQVKLQCRADTKRSPEERLANTRVLQAEVNAFRATLDHLNKGSTSILPSLDQPSVIQVTAYETRLSERLRHLQQALGQHAEHLQVLCARQVQFNTTCAALTSFLQDVDDILSGSDDDTDADLHLRRDQLKDLFASFAPKQELLDKLNEMAYKLPLSKQEADDLSKLNEKWHALQSQCKQRQAGLQDCVLKQDDFLAKCDDWMRFLNRVENDLAQEPSGAHAELLRQKQQLGTLQFDLHSRQPVLTAILSEGHNLLGSLTGYAGSDFQHKLLVLDAQWNNVLARAKQRAASVDRALALWEKYTKDKEDMMSRLDQCERQLADVLDPTVSGVPLQTLPQISNTLQSVQRGLSQVTPVHQRLTASADDLTALCHDPVTTDTIATELRGLEERHRRLLEGVSGRARAVGGVEERWRRLEAGMEQMLEWLKDTRHELGRALPTSFPEVTAALKECEAFEAEFQQSEERKNAFEPQLRALSEHVANDDMTYLHQRHLLLVKQWAELGHQVALRRQRLADTLDQWAAFSAKHAELTSWLQQAEDRLAATPTHTHIEDIIARMQHSFAEEMSQIAREKEVLLQRGHHLVALSNDLQSHDIRQKMDALQRQWQHVHDTLNNRLSKLRQTLAAVHKLESNMAKLRGWLAGVEHELSLPPAYQTADLSEIARQLSWQQAVARDVETHGGSVASVLSLCEILLHDADACPGTSETTAIEHARDTLQTRWKNICTMLNERKLRIEETGRLWETFNNDYDRLMDWMAECERQAKFPNTDANFALIKEEMGLYQSFKDRLHRSLSQLEALNKQYRRLAREGRTDSEGQIKQKIEEANHTWDELSRRTAAIIRRLQHMSNVSTDFDATRQALTVWLSDMDMRLTRAESLGLDTPYSEATLNEIEDDLEENRHRLEYIDKAGSYLMQKCDPNDSVQIQHDVEDFHERCEQVVSHLQRLQKQRRKGRKDKPKKSRLLGAAYGEEGASSGGDGQSEEEGYLPAGRRDRPDGQEPLFGDSATSGRGNKMATYTQQLEQALLYANEKLSAAEKETKKSPPRKPHKMSGVLAGCQASVDALKTLESQALQDTGLPLMPTLDRQIQGTVDRWHVIQGSLKSRGRDRRDDRQLKEDVNNLEAWLVEAEGVQATQSTLPEDIWMLEETVRRHREFLLQVESRKPTVLAINIAAKDPDTDPALRDQISAVNQRWDRVCARAGVWQKELQIALLHSTEFRGTLQQLQDWIRNVETQIRRLEPVRLEAPRAALIDKYNRFREHKLDLERARPKVIGLQDTTQHLLLTSAADDDDAEAGANKAKLASISRRVDKLLKVCTNYLTDIERVVGINTDYSSARAQDDDGDEGKMAVAGAAAADDLGLPWQRPWPRDVSDNTTDKDMKEDIEEDEEEEEEEDDSVVGAIGLAALVTGQTSTYARRVFRAALPIQALMVLLLGAASLVPMTEDDFSCILANNLRRSFDPVLDYMEGQPPF